MESRSEIAARLLSVKKAYVYQGRFIRSQRKVKGFTQVTLAGVAVAAEEQDWKSQDDWERIDCDVIIVPRSTFKHTGNNNMRIDQIMMTLGQDSAWEKTADIDLPPVAQAHIEAELRCFRLKSRMASRKAGRLGNVTNQRDYIGVDRLMNHGMKTFNRYNGIKGHEAELYEKVNGKWVRMTQTALNKIYDEWKRTNKR